ncbi:MAG TPA: HEAT repeat domain-containing protein [Spirochaetota bacterium]|nr:HEAT repeat domain-containing protein [Spirochaetota bacterium]HOM09861.1 HEAT repeat domain-containing protein [Spirochaetota bacterium]HPP49756.1 HEAT repeat domain-containing protein [Spirochaetota bacterium]
MRKICFIVIIMLTSLSIIPGQQLEKKNMDVVGDSSQNKSIEDNTQSLTAESPTTQSAKDEKKDINNTSQEKKKITEEKQKDISQDKKIEAEKRKTEWIKKTIQYGIQDDRIDAIKSTLTIKDPSQKNDIIKLLDELMPQETNPEVKRTAITVVSELKSSSSSSWIIASLNDNSEEVKIAAVYAIDTLKATEAIPKLEGILKEQKFTENSNFTEALIRTLGKLKDTQLKDFAIERIKDTKTTDNLRQLFILFLGDLEDISSKDFLLGIVKDKDEDTTIRSYAAVALAKIGAKDTAGDLLEIIKEIDSYPVNKRKDYYSFSMYCTAALVKMGDSNAIPRLMEALRSNNPVVRLRAVELMKDLKDKRTIDILKYKIQYDPSPKVQKAAKEALKEMGENVDESK